MSDTDRVFAGSIPEVYDRLMVPMIFDPYAHDMADRVAGLNACDILETAAGTGALTRAMLARLPVDIRITATDLNQPMLDLATAKSSGDRRVSWQQADALALPFPDHSFDVVVCQFGIMFFPEKVQGYREARRVLKPGGTFLFSVWDHISENHFVNVISRALAGVFPDNPPTFMVRTPHGFHDVAVIGRDLVAAGFASSAVETRDHMAKAASAHDAAMAYCQGTPLKAEIEARDAGRLEEAVQAAADALVREFGEGPIAGRIRAHIISAVR